MAREEIAAIYREWQIERAQREAIQLLSESEESIQLRFDDMKTAEREIALIRNRLIEFYGPDGYYLDNKTVFDAMIQGQKLFFSKRRESSA